jgi:hypothetical protein
MTILIDHFSVVEAAALQLVKDHIDNRDVYFDVPEDQVVASDETVLTTGHDYFLISFPSIFPTEYGGAGMIKAVWSISMEMFVRFSTPPETWAHFKAFRSDIFNLFNVRIIGHNLNRTAGVESVLLTSEGAPTAFAEEDTPSDPVFFSQRMLLTVQYKINKQP